MFKYLSVGPILTEYDDPRPLLLSAALSGVVDGIITADLAVADVVRSEFSHNFSVKGMPGQLADGNNNYVFCPAAAVIHPKTLKSCFAGESLEEVVPNALSVYDWNKYCVFSTQIHGKSAYLNMGLVQNPPRDLIYLTKPFSKKSMAIAINKTGDLFAVASSVKGLTTYEKLGTVKFNEDSNFSLEDFDANLFRSYTSDQISHSAIKAYHAAKLGDSKLFCSMIDLCWSSERKEIQRLGAKVPTEIDMFYASLRSDRIGCGGRATPTSFAWVELKCV